MKKMLLSIISLFIYLNGFAQFKVTPDGIKTENGDSFVIVKVEGSSQKELYQRCESILMKEFVNPEKVLSRQPYNMITLHGVYPDAVQYSNDGTSYDVDCTITFMFKDGKVRIDAPVIEKLTDYDYGITDTYLAKGGSRFSTGAFYLYKKDGTPRAAETIANLEKWVNQTICEYKKKLQINEEW